MRVEVLLFAAARELAGRDRVVVDVGDQPTAGDVLRSLGEAAPALQSLIPACRLAVDSQYVASEAALEAPDEVALIPPVSGG